ncbi:hypothetical protein [Streptomyces sp. CC210A]|uniref:hypothetical protein n=1 Tax=Streptomyces sp. CC210A TaxID=2898184 RepID=UPI001F48A8F4|nr:hypothetical protein [Streptomyces sp. CC210A]
MKHSEKALANGWGWVLGVSGQECRVQSRPAQHVPADDPAELLGRATKLLGVAAPTEVLAAISQLKDDRAEALSSAETAWRAVGEIARRLAGEG